MSRFANVSLKVKIYFVVLISILLIAAGLLIKPRAVAENTYISEVDFKNILVAVGTSLLASSIFAYFSVKNINKENERIELFEKLGLVTLHLERHAITTKCSELLKKAEQIDITAIRLKTLLELHEKQLNNLLRNTHVKIRILLPYPGSESANIIEQLLDANESILTGLKNVLDWESRLKTEKLTGTLEIRFSKTLISSMYQRIDNVVFTGPYMRKTESQETFTLECDATGDFGKMLSGYFNRRFKEADKRPKGKPYIIELMGMPGAGKSSCINLLKQADPNLVSHSNEDIECTASDTPYEFNLRLVKSLQFFVENIQKHEVVFLDRGLEDLKIWLQFHLQNNNITAEEFFHLNNMIPKCPLNVNYYKILFIQKPDFTKKRRVVERRVDEWALLDTSLESLFNLYEKSRNQQLIVIDSTLPLNVMAAQVMKAIEEIIEIEKSLF
jgi:hypothetical protein